MKVIEKKDTPTLSVRFRTPVSGLPGAIGEAYAEIGSFMEKTRLSPLGAPYVAYFNMDMNDLDVEAGFPVASVPGSLEGRLRESLIKGGSYATITHKGPYDQMEPSYEKLMEWIKNESLDVDMSYMWEEYINSPEDTPPEELLTNIYYKLSD